MSLILHIDTAVEAASICISTEEKILASARNPQSRESAGWLQPAIQQVMRQAGYTIKDLKAVSVSAGPGSYTGLRVGMASAKGLCYALNIPLICIGTLQIMTAAALKAIKEDIFFCPMIDARRMEVFAAIYNRELQPLLPPHNAILDKESYATWLQQSDVLFFGNGSGKLQPLLHAPSARFENIDFSAEDMVSLALEKFCSRQFSDLAYTEPLYGKAFYTTQS